MKKFLNALFRGVEILIAIFLAIMILMLFMNVVLRQFGKGFAWSEEIARFAFIYLVYLGSIGAAHENRHLLIDSILTRIPAAAQKILYALIQVCIIALMWILTTGAWGLAYQNRADRWVATHIPMVLIHGIGVVVGGAIIIISLANLFRLIVLKEPVKNLIASPDDPTDNNPAMQTKEVG
ncbi:ABC transporter permease [Spirochaetia bacterium]|nr:ABC transporter permease [Spirochaetia bacterium]